MVRTRLFLPLLPVLLGLVVTLATLFATTDISAAPEAYAGTARVYGAPHPFYYTIGRGGQLMAAQVWCNKSMFCTSYLDATVGGPFMLLPFLADVLIWSVVATVTISIGALGMVATRRRRR